MAAKCQTPARRKRQPSWQPASRLPRPKMHSAPAELPQLLLLVLAVGAVAAQNGTSLSTPRAEMLLPGAAKPATGATPAGPASGNHNGSRFLPALSKFRPGKLLAESPNLPAPANLHAADVERQHQIDARDKIRAN